MNNQSIYKLIQEYDTPLYIYDLDIAKERIAELKETLPSNVQLFYSVKTNPNTFILKGVHNHVEGMEVASLGELEKALLSGVEASNIIFVGPGKSYKELEVAVQKDIYCIIVESLREAEIINSIGLKYHKQTGIAVRVNPIHGNKSARIKMGGEPRPFGIDEEIVLEVIDCILTFNHIQFRGIYTYNGTQTLEAEHITESFESTFQIAKMVQEHIERPLQFIGFGGGYGISYFGAENNLDMKALKLKLQELFNRYQNIFSKTIRYISESGRYIIAESGYYVVKVLYKKQSRGTNYVVVDGGSNFYSSAAGMGRFLRRNLPVFVLNASKEEPLEKISIVGPLCTPMDTISQNVILPKCNEGDYIVFPKAGAYGLSASPVGFISHEQPHEVVIEE